ncbi:MAG: hypothetical protein ABSC26_10755 [Stellaceae bacterium]
MHKRTDFRENADMTVLNSIRRFLLPLGLLCLALTWAAPGHAQMAPGFSVSIAPPPLPVYSEPPLPADGYIFIPGYWAWGGPNGFYWVPGTWVQPPAPGLLWTPGYWSVAADGVSYVWQPGYWGPSVGFYGGVDYGFGYYGTGYDGGYWDSGFFFYNSRVHNFGHVRVAHSFAKAVPAVRSARVSFTGAARGGVDARPGPNEDAASHEQHAPAVDLQVQHETKAATIRSAPVAVNHGRPPVAATQQPATFTGHGIVAARPVTSHPAPTRASSPPPQSQSHGSPPPSQGDDRDHH